MRDVVFPELIRRNQSLRKLRIWSAGCSISAEPYSIAIQLKTQTWGISSMDGRSRSWPQTSIESASIGLGQDATKNGTFRSVPEEIKHSCFQRSGNAWAINPIYQENVSFQYHNLVREIRVPRCEIASMVLTSSSAGTSRFISIRKPFEISCRSFISASWIAAGSWSGTPSRASRPIDPLQYP